MNKLFISAPKPDVVEKANKKPIKNDLVTWKYSQLFCIRVCHSSCDNACVQHHCWRTAAELVWHVPPAYRTRASPPERQERDCSEQKKLKKGRDNPAEQRLSCVPSWLPASLFGQITPPRERLGQEAELPAGCHCHPALLGFSNAKDWATCHNDVVPTWAMVPLLGSRLAFPGRAAPLLPPLARWVTAQQFRSTQLAEPVALQ